MPRRVITGEDVLELVTPRESTTLTTDEAVSIAVVDAVADLEDTTVADIDPPLYEVVDPDALDRLFMPTEDNDRNDGRVSFEYLEYTITITSDGFIRIGDGAGAD